MRIAVATVQVPFIRGGAENLADGLVTALREHGHQPEMITMPFRFGPPSEVERAMDVWAAEDLTILDSGAIDKVICLKFPTYYLRHPDKTAWLLHQHRGVYELFDTPYGDSSSNEASVKLRENIITCDTKHLRAVTRIYTIAKRVSARLKTFNNINSKALYHPPAHADRFYCGERLPYIFFPSRLEGAKRQEMLIRAIAHVRSPVCAIIAGDGGMMPKLARLIEELGVSTRVRLLGSIGMDEMLSWYANSLGVFFGPFDEDYGYVTLEAMLSSKPLITCSDSGGPLEFVVDNETGLVVEPHAMHIANAIDQLYSNPGRSTEMGQEGLARYSSLGITWEHVVSTLLEKV